MSDRPTATVHALPPPATAAALKHVMAALASAQAAGSDLGPRGPHIRALGVALAQSAAQLNEVLVSLRLEPALRADLDVMLDTVGEAAASARVYAG